MSASDHELDHFVEIAVLDAQLREPLFDFLGFERCHSASHGIIDESPLTGTGTGSAHPPMAQPPVKKTAVGQFLAEVKSHPVANTETKRIIFAMDATASREATWDLAAQLHAEMFIATQATRLSVQLAYFRGYNEFHASAWHQTSGELLELIQSVRCRSGITQIERVLQHAKTEAVRSAVKALVYIGDCCEEPPDRLYAAAGTLGVKGVPVFVLQEGDDPVASLVFAQIARLSRGAHMPFAHHSKDALRELLAAIGAFVAEGRTVALNRLRSPTARRLLEQLDP